MNGRRQYFAQHEWSLYKSGLKKRWNNLSDESLDRCQGNFEELVNVINRQCGGSPKNIQNYIDKLWFEIYVRNRRWRRHVWPALEEAQR